MSQDLRAFGSRIVGAGSGFPKRVMTNKEFEAFVETSDEWIRTRTGIQTRRIADPAEGESTLTLAKEASIRALEFAGVKPQDIDLIIVGTVTPDTVMPSTAVQLQHELGATKAFGFDLSAACSGFLYGLSIADKFISSGAYQTALVVGAETLSTMINWRDRNTCVLFGDGAGAVVLKRTETEHRILATQLHSDGSYGHLLNIPHGYAKVPPDSAEYRHDMHKIHMNGKEVFKLAVRNMVEAAQAALDEVHLTTDDVDFFIFHQANLRILEMCARILGIDETKMWVNLDKYGNTSAATLPVCLDEAWRAKKVKEGDIILVATFGGGLTWGAGVIRL